jgi:glycosyltransferase involved in cell wall biosynthesis
VVDVWYWRNIQKLTLHKAASIISISETTAHDLEQFYALPPGKIKVIYPSIDPRFRPAGPAEVGRVRQRYGLPEHFVLHVGRIDRKKNLTLLVEAFAQACRLSGPGFSDDLVLVGDVAKKSQDADLLPTIERLGLSERVHFTGRIPDADLPAIYSAARLAVSVSLHEGLAWQRWALACGAPLLAYQAAALQEAVGDAALVLNTLDCPAWAEALARLLSDVDLRHQLSQKGLLRAQLYQRERNARQTLQLYQEVARP